MATNDILFVGGPTSVNGSKSCRVLAGATTINPGEPVVRALGATTVTVMATNKPVVATDYVVGIATTTSTQTASADGRVQVQPLIPGQIYSIKPKVAATWNTQSEYDALVGKRVLIDLTSSSYTILAADGATSGCVIEDKDVNVDPGRIYFSFRNGLSDLA